MILSYLRLLYVTGQQQAASLCVKGSRFAAHGFVGFPVQSDGSWFSGRHCRCIKSHSQLYLLAKTQVKAE